MGISDAFERGRARAAASGTAAPIPAAAPAGAPPPEAPTAEASRALRTGYMLNDAAQAFGDFQAGEALRQRNFAANPTLDAFQRGAAARVAPMVNQPPPRPAGQPPPPASPPLQPAEQEALHREKLRAGQYDTIGPRTAPTTWGERLDRAKTWAVDAGKSALRYPLEGLTALTRPLSPLTGAPSVYARVRGLDPDTVMASSADPLGRFDVRGARGPAFTNSPIGWGDVTEAALERWGKPVPGTETRDAKGNVVVPPELEIRRDGTAPGQGAGIGVMSLLGLVGDVALDPLTYTAAPKGGPTRLGGIKLAPAAELALREKTGLAQAGRAVEKAGSAVYNIPAGSGRTLGERVGSFFDKYHELSRAGGEVNPGVGPRAVSAAQLGEAATRKQINDALDRVDALLGKDDELARRVRDYIEAPDKFTTPQPREPYVPPKQPGTAIAPAGGTGLGASEGVPVEPTEKFAGKGKSTGRPAVMFGDGASPTGATPDAVRYGAAPGAAFQVPDLPLHEVEVAARVEDQLRDVKLALQKRGLLGEGRQNYFPRELTRETMRDLGIGPNAQTVGIGSKPAFKTSGHGFQNPRGLTTWVNELVDRANIERQAKGLEPLPYVRDTTADLNAFMANTPPDVARRIDPVDGGKLYRPQREFFLDSPQDALKRYFSRSTKAVNDYDTFKAFADLTDDAGKPIAVKDAFDHHGRAYRWADEIPGPETSGGPARTGPGEPAMPGAPQLEAGRMGRKREAIVKQERPALPGEVQDKGAVAGVSAREGPTAQELPGYKIPKHVGFQREFPGVALPEPIAREIERMGEPYWNRGTMDWIARGLHKVQLPWKVAATSGAGPRFALRNYYGQQVMNLEAYGHEAMKPWAQGASHVLALPDAVFAARPSLADTKITVNGQTWTYGELREFAKQSGLWRQEARGVEWQLPNRTDTPMYGKSSWQGKTRDAIAAVNEKLGPVNPFSSNFAPTKHVFHPMAEYTERQGRMLGMLMELTQGKGPVEAAMGANLTHADYGRFSKEFSKYAGLVYPFAKWNAAMMGNVPQWWLRRPGAALVQEKVQRAGEHMVKPEIRAQYQQEPRSDFEAEGGARLMGWPGMGGTPLLEPETSRAKGPFRLPFTTTLGIADNVMNTWGAPARIASDETPAAQAAQELLSGAFPTFKAPVEALTGKNVFTGESVRLHDPVAAPRILDAMIQKYPGAEKYLMAQRVTDPRKRDAGSYWAVPQAVNLLWRYYPNVAAADLVAAVTGKGARPYDNQTAFALRLAGITQLLHDPMQEAVKRAKTARDAAQEYRKTQQKWLGPTE